MAGLFGEGGDTDEFYRPLAEINVTPLVDVMLVLLVIFMVTAPLMTAGIKVDLPKAGSAAPLNPKEPLVVSVGKDGALSLGADPIALEDLLGAVRARLGDDPSRVVHIRGDKDAAFGIVVAVMDRLSQGGVSHLAIVTGRKPDAPAQAP